MNLSHNPQCCELCLSIDLFHSIKYCRNTACSCHKKAAVNLHDPKFCDTCLSDPTPVDPKPPGWEKRFNKRFSVTELFSFEVPAFKDDIKAFIREELLDVLLKTREVALEEGRMAERTALREKILSIPTENPERESDEYDTGRRDFKKDVLAVLNR